MNKAGLVDAVAGRTGYAKSQVEATLDAAFETFAASVARGDAVTVQGWLRIEPDGRGGGRAVTGGRLRGPAQAAARSPRGQ